MQRRLPLAWAAEDVAPLAVALNLSNMAAHRLPPLDLPPIILDAATPK